MEVDDDNDEEEDLEEERFRWTTPLSILSSMLLQESPSLSLLSNAFFFFPLPDDAQFRSELVGLPERRPLAFFEPRMKSVSETCFGC